MMAEEKYFLSIKADEINDVLVRASTKPEGAHTGNFPVFSASRDLADSGRNTDSYALALKTTDGPAASIDIYPDEGGNIVVTAHGYTEQAGAGNPSPTNIRPITAGGKPLVKLIIDESTKYVAHGNRPEYYGFYVQYILDIPADPADNTVYCAKLPTPSDILSPDGAIVTLNSGTRLSILPKAVGITTISGWKQYLADNPITVWYPPADKSKATGIYAPVVLSGLYERYKTPCLELRAKLFDGDYVNSNGTESHQKTFYQFDGSENWYLYNNNNYPQLVVLDLDFLPYGGAKSIVCSHAIYNKSYKSGGLFTTPSFRLIQLVPTGGQWGNIVSGWTDETLVDLWKAWLKQQHDAGTPVQMIVIRQESLVYEHDQIPIPAEPDETGKITVSGEKTVSATYNKSLSHALSELQSAIIALGANMQGGL